MEKPNCNVEEMDQGDVALVVELAKAFGESAVANCTGLGDALWLPAARFVSFVWVFPAPANSAL